MSLVTDVRTLIDEPSGGVFWTDQHVYDACNEQLLRAYFHEKGFRRESATLTITSGQDFVGIPAAIAVPHYIIYGSREYWPSTYQMMERYSENWRGEEASQPKAFIVWDHRTLRVWPAADGTYEMTVYGISWPDEIAAGNQDITEDSTLKNCIAFRAASSLLQTTLPRQSAVYEQQAKELELKWHKHARGFRGQDKFNRLRPGTSFTIKQHGNPSLFRGWY
jgi:hypothetical protein